MNDRLHFARILLQEGREPRNNQAILLGFDLVDFADGSQVQRLTRLDVFNGVLDQFVTLRIESLDCFAQFYGWVFRWRLRRTVGLCIFRRLIASVGAGIFLSRVRVGFLSVAVFIKNLLLICQTDKRILSSDFQNVHQNYCFYAISGD